MVLRRDIYPKTRSEIISTGSNVIFTPLNYYVFNFVVLPKYFEIWSPEYNKHFITSSILTFMMCAHLFALILSDTSVRGSMSLPLILVNHWKFCDKCDTAVPPRSWHCNICDKCILKRDHHCFFTSCCVGFYNHRYFYMYLFYTTLTTFYASYFNFQYMKDNVEIELSWNTLLKFLFPFISIFFIEWTALLFHVFIILETLGFGLMTFIMMHICGYLIARNMVLFYKIRDEKYDKGLLDNIKVVFGERWYLVWLGPWIRSDLPCDGINWDNYQK